MATLSNYTEIYWVHTLGSPSSHVTIVSLVSVGISKRGSIPLSFVDINIFFKSSQSNAILEVHDSCPKVLTSVQDLHNAKKNNH